MCRRSGKCAGVRVRAATAARGPPWEHVALSWRGGAVGVLRCSKTYMTAAEDDLVARYARRQQPSAFGDTTLTNSVDVIVGHATDDAALRDEARFDEGGVFGILAGHPAVELLKPRRSGVLRGVPCRWRNLIVDVGVGRCGGAGRRRLAGGRHGAPRPLRYHVVGCQKRLERPTARVGAAGGFGNPMHARVLKWLRSGQRTQARVARGHAVLHYT